jgi:2-polyprenyl-6-methoxyphenol hydroxylase-like FAD-dependent oxidoreductase
MTSIGIVGTGISGLTLALSLQRAGVDTTVYAEEGPDDMRRGRLANTAMRFGPAIARERALGVEHWAPNGDLGAYRFAIAGTPLAFTGRMVEPASVVDFRIYLPRLLEDYAARGGRVVIGPMSSEDIVAGDAHDLTVVASGRASVAAFFPRDPRRSPHAAPQRRLCAMLCHGIAPARPGRGSATLVPGAGEIFEFPWLSPHGVVAGILVEAIAAGPFEALTRADRAQDPAAFDALALDLLQAHAPDVAERIDGAAFALTGPRDVLQGALTPTVRKPYCEVAPGRFVVAVGDAYVTNDPICAQGANLGSATAEVLAQAICRDVAFDEWFCRSLERDLWAAAEPATRLSNSFLSPPSPQLQAIFGAASELEPVADAFVRNFADPAAMWRSIATPERAAAFVSVASATDRMASVA